MPITTTTLTGPIYMPNGETPTNGKVIFELSSWDREEDEAIFVSGPYITAIDENGNFEIDLFTTTEGENSAIYRMSVVYQDPCDSDKFKTEYIGFFALSGEGPFNISHLDIESELISSSFDVLAECKAFALAAQNSVGQNYLDEVQAVRDQAFLALNNLSVNSVVETYAEAAALNLSSSNVVLILKDEQSNNNRTFRVSNGTTLGTAIIANNLIMSPSQPVPANTTLSAVGKNWYHASATNAPATLTETSLIAAGFVSIENKLLEFETRVSNIEDRIITGHRNITAGESTSDFPTVVSALEWIKTTLLLGTISVIVEGHASEDINDPRAFVSYLFDHPYTNRVDIKATLIGAIPTKADFEGLTRTEAIAFAKTRYSGSIYLTGSTNVKYGLAAPHGLKGITNILRIQDDRYPLDISFTGGHASSSSFGGGFAVSGSCTIGGLWGAIIRNKHVHANTEHYSGYRTLVDGNQGAGAYNFLNCTVRFDIAKFYIHEDDADGGAKYGMFADEKTIIYIGNNKSFMSGNILHGYYLRGGSQVEGYGPEFDGVSQLVSMDDNCSFTAPSVIATGGRTTNPETNTIVGTDQGGFGNNNLSGGALFSVGSGCVLDTHAGTFSDMEARYLVWVGGGTVLWGVSTKAAIDNCLFTAALASGHTSSSNHLLVGVTNPKSGSKDGIAANSGTTWILGASTGLNEGLFSPPLDTSKNGNLITYNSTGAGTATSDYPVGFINLGDWADVNLNTVVTNGVIRSINSTNNGPINGPSTTTEGSCKITTIGDWIQQDYVVKSGVNITGIWYRQSFTGGASWIAWIGR